jgi:DNA-3-methyladenine glycosylase I
MAAKIDWGSRGVARLTDGHNVCPWCVADPIYVRYHDEEWGRPLHDDAQLFELLCLEGAQAGLSWLTVLRKRESYRRAFDHFDAAKIARYTARKKQQLLRDPGIVRNRLKVDAFIGNARACLEIQAGGPFADFLWQFAPPPARRARPRKLGDIPVSTPQSDAMSRELKRRGFKFVGSTICYAFMQASGMVDDHLQGCSAIARPAAARKRR